MKLTKKELSSIIKEELRGVIKEFDSESPDIHDAWDDYIGEKRGTTMSYHTDEIIEGSIGEYFYYLPLTYFSEYNKPEDMGWGTGYDGEEVMSDMEQESRLPPIVVDAWYDDGNVDFSLVGGRHRLLMSIRTGESVIPAIVFYPRTEESYEVLKNYGHHDSQIFDIDEVLNTKFESNFI